MRNYEDFCRLVITRSRHKLNCKELARQKQAREQKEVVRKNGESEDTDSDSGSETPTARRKESEEDEETELPTKPVKIQLNKTIVNESEGEQEEPGVHKEPPTQSSEKTEPKIEENKLKIKEESKFEENKKSFDGFSNSDLAAHGCSFSTKDEKKEKKAEVKKAESKEIPAIPGIGDTPIGETIEILDSDDGNKGGTKRPRSSESEMPSKVKLLTIYRGEYRPCTTGVDIGIPKIGISGSGLEKIASGRDGIETN